MPYYYYDGAVFPFGSWRHEDRPIPRELRNPELYGRKGRIRNFDAIPETRDGDFSDLKAFLLDESPKSLRLQELLIKIHCYWIRECDVDGFRLDAVKHMSELAISRFCSSVREYAYKLGKKNFFLFGELVAQESMYDDYMGPKTPVAGEDKTIYYGLNSVLDFQLHRILPDVILGQASPERLIERYESLRHGAVDRGPFGEFLVTFIDNHDQVGQWPKHRFGKEANDKQIIAGIGFLLCALGSPCIYYGTEQGFDGNGEGDAFIRECMFNLDDTVSNSMNKNCDIYKRISRIANLRREHRALKFGRMYIRKVSVDREHFHFPNCKECLLAFSRVLFDDELLVAYNISGSETKTEFVQVDANGDDLFEVVFGSEGIIPVERVNDSFSYVKLELSPLQFVVLVRSHQEAIHSNPAVL